MRRVDTAPDGGFRPGPYRVPTSQRSLVMERSGQLTHSVIGPGGAQPMSGFHQVLDITDVDVDLRSLIDRWSTEGEVGVVRRPGAAPRY